MCWLKRERWKASIALVGVLLLLVLMVWIPVSAGAQERASVLATPRTGTMQATPTVDVTVTALSKEKLGLETDQLKNQNRWAWTTLLIGIGPFSIGIAGFLAALISFMALFKNQKVERQKRDEEREHWLVDLKAEQERRAEEHQHWLDDLKAEQEKRAEDRFQKVVEGLGGSNEEAKVGAAIVLRTFLGPDYKQFNRQAFDLAVAHLRLPPSEEKGQGLRRRTRRDDPPLLELTSLRQALISIFAEALPGTRDEWRKGLEKEQLFDPRHLNATHIILDEAYLWKTDLQQIWLGWTFLRKTSLCQANLSGTWLWHADLGEADLAGADLRRADLGHANLHRAGLGGAKLRGATLWGADLCGADLCGADLSNATLEEAPFLLTLARQDKRDKESTTLLLADLRGADLRRANLQGATLSLADLRKADLREANLNEADLCGADLRGARLDKAQMYKTKLGRILLSGPHLTQGKLTENEIREIKLTEPDLTEVKNRGVDLNEVDRSTLPWKELRRWVHYIGIAGPGADLYEPQLLLSELSDTNLENALSLQDTDLRGAKGLDDKQKATCKAKGAIIDVAPTTSVTFAQVSIPTPDTCYWKAYSTHGGTTSAQVNTPLLCCS